MADIRIGHQNGDVAKYNGVSYLASYDSLAGKDGYWISESFFRSSDFDRILIKVLFKYYPKELEAYMIEKEGFSCSVGAINEILDRIKDESIIKYIAKERDGFINSIILPTDELDNVIIGAAFGKWAKENNIKRTDIIFVKL